MKILLYQTSTRYRVKNNEITVLTEFSMSPADLVIVDEQFPDPWEEIASYYISKSTPVYLYSEDAGIEELKIAKKVGCSGVISDLETELPIAIRKISNTQISNNRIDKSRIPVQQAPQVPSKIESTSQVVIRNQIIVTYAPKGGVGKTTFSANLAAYLAKNTNLKVCLADMDSNWGNAADTLGITPEVSILDWVEGQQYEDIKTCIHVHEESGLSIVAAPPNPADHGAVTGEVTQKMLSILARRFDIVVVDTGPIIRSSTLEAIKMATLVLVPVTPDLIPIKDVRKTIPLFKALGVPLDIVKIVINRQGLDKANELRVDNIYKLVEQFPEPMEVYGIVQEDANVRGEVNRGNIPALSRKAIKYRNSIGKIAEKIVPGSGQKKHPLPIFKLLKRG